MMGKAKFKIGDRVCYGTAEGTITEVFSGNDNTAYGVDFGEHGVSLYFEAELEPVQEYSMDIKIDIAGNVVIATLYEDDGNTKTPLHKGHGHIIHEGEQGIAQAASYACWQLYKSVRGEKR